MPRGGHGGNGETVAVPRLSRHHAGVSLLILFPILFLWGAVGAFLAGFLFSAGVASCSLHLLIKS